MDGATFGADGGDELILGIVSAMMAFTGAGAKPGESAVLRRRVTDKSDVDDGFFCREQRWGNITHEETAEDEQIIKVSPEAVKKGGYGMIRGMPRVEICEVLPKATANGNKRLTYAAQTCSPGSPTRIQFTAGFHGIDVPVTSRRSILMDVDPTRDFSVCSPIRAIARRMGLVKNEDGSRRAGSRGYQQV